jgi:hypothetical protein
MAGSKLAERDLNRYAAIAGYDTASTPGIVIDGRVVHDSGWPKPDDFGKCLTA